MLNKIQCLKEMLERLNVWYKEEHSMALCTSFKVGGNADLYCKTADKKAIKAIVSYCKCEDIPITLIGRGSNLIVGDKGIRGVVLAIVGGTSDIVKTGETSFYASAGVSLAAIANYALSESLTGAEFIHGIPGSLGGGIYMNAGAYRGELKDIISRIHHLDTELIEGSFTPYEAFMTYRYSDYCVNNFIITGAEFNLAKGDQKEIKEWMEHLAELRSSKQPLDKPSAGSTFKRPKGAFAAALIEECGLKGLSVGGAMVSEKHSGFVVNTGGATASDILALCDKVKDVVNKEKGFELELEPILIGEF